MIEAVVKLIDSNYRWIEGKLDRKTVTYYEPIDAEAEFSMRFAQLIRESLQFSEDINPQLRDAVVQIKNLLQLHKFDEFEPIRVTIYSSEEAVQDTRDRLVEEVKTRLSLINDVIKAILPAYYSKPEEKPLSNNVDYWVTNISQTYGVNVQTVDTNQLFEAEETMRRGEQEGIFFVSKEDPEGTAKTTIHLLKRRAIRQEMLLGDPKSNVRTEVDFQERSRALIDIANKKRFDISQNNAKEAKEKILEVIEDYRRQNEGKEPRVSKIAEILTQQRFPTSGKAKKWYSETVKRVLEKTSSNELG